jgi:uncharacterized LabA/DUF88 family protein
LARLGRILCTPAAAQPDQSYSLFYGFVTPRADDPQQRIRQETYLRALRTIPNLSVYTSHFLASKVWMKRANDPGYVRVLKSEEKGSDVNLASALLIDCDRSDCDIAVIVSNDSDLTFPIEHVKRHLGKIIGIINPHKRPSRELLEFLQIRPSERACSMSISNEAH